MACKAGRNPTLRLRPPGRARGVLAGLVLGSALAACSRLEAPRVVITGAPPALTDRPIEVPPPRFTSSDACRACHAREYETWHASFHRTMTQEVGPETVIPPWEGEQSLRDEVYRFERRGDEFWVEMNDPEVDANSPEWNGAPPRVWREIVMSTGSHNFQTYWFPSGDSRKLYMFSLAYRIDEGRWLPIDSAFIEPPNAYRKPTLPRWNLVCLGCHTTKPRPHVEGPDEMNTVAGEFGIACEACHGPGRDHVEANQNPLRRYRLHLGDEHDQTIVDPTRLSPVRSSQVCGQCHGITEIKPEFAAQWNEHGYSYEPGKNLFLQRNLVTGGEEYFWSDGQVRVSGREYNGLVQSPCFERGAGPRTMSCFSCHQMHRGADDPRPLEEWRVHQLKPGMREDQGCLQCHGEFAEPAGLAEHTRHAPGVGAPSCYDCHMPRTVWGLLKAIRSHQVTSPSVQETLATGRPNACNLCHLDRPLSWTAEALAAGYGIPQPELDQEQREVAFSALWTLTGDAGKRALMAWHMGWESARAASGSEWMAPYLATLLDDPYDAVRYRSLRSLRELPGFEDFGGDFVADPGELTRMRERALALWRDLEARPADDAALLMEGGGLNESAFLDLLARRDQRRMVLAE